MPAATDFRALERQNRRRTIILVVTVMALFMALGFGLDLMTGDFQFDNAGHLIGFPVLSIAALCFGGVQSVVSFYGGANLVLLSVHARKLEPDTAQHQVVLDVINEMSLASRMPAPIAYLMDDPSPNAFATGRDPQHSVICVTQGLVEQMDREELQGVIGHEMAHVRDYDIRTMTMIAVMIGGIAMLSDFVYRVSFYGGFGARRSRSDGEGGGEAGVIVAVVVIILAAVAPVFAQLLAMAVSREREYLADASSVEFTRNPRALLRALERLAQVEQPLQISTSGTAHLFMINPREGLRENDRDGFFDNLLSTHPPLGKRIERLRALLHESPGNAAQTATRS